MAKDQVTDELKRLLHETWQRLGRGLADSRSPLSTPVMATVGLDGQPNARTVALWRVEPERRRLYFNTDSRSPKHRELLSLPSATFVFYDTGSEVQLRFRTAIRLHYDDALSSACWAELPSETRELFLTAQAPGTRAATPTDGRPTANADGTAGPPAHFVVLEAIATHLDWLHAAPQRHRRAGFAWGPDGRLDASWLYP